jgi:predicted TPR repeat methyltransferase
MSWGALAAAAPIDAVAARVRALYDQRYAELYPSLYLAPWSRKHQINVENLEGILSELGSSPRWLDLACGHAWHFSMFPGRARALGIDISEAQLVQARSNAKDAAFLCADMIKATFSPGSFDLVTNFWAGYCYLDSRTRIEDLVRSAVEWIAPGGAFYFEVLVGSDLADFNRSQFAQRTGFAVAPRRDDFSAWQYEDIGGLHLMASPPLEAFIEIVSPSFSSVEARHDGAFMFHVIARGRR